MDLTQVLLLVIAGLGTWLFFERRNNGELGSTINKLNTLDKLKDLTHATEKTEEQLKAEEADRQEIINKLNKLAEKASIEDIKKFFNTPDKS